MPQLTKQQFTHQVAEILRDNITFAPQLHDYVIHGALEKIWELHCSQIPTTKAEQAVGQKTTQPTPQADISNYTSTRDFLNDILLKGAKLDAFVISDEERKWITERMKQLDIEERRKSAQAFIDLSKIIITI